MLIKIVLISFFSFCIYAEEIDLRSFEIRRIAQHGEDGVLEKIFQLIGTTNKYYVEFGAGDGHFCSNVKYFKEKYGWIGLLMDGGFSNNVEENEKINLHREFITAENICDLFRKYNVPREFDLISIDIDRNDFYVWKALSKSYSPRVVVIEFNSIFGAGEDKVVKYTADAVWDGSPYFGASILAFYNLARSLGYSLVYEESETINLFFVRDDVIKECGAKFKDMNDVHKLFKPCPEKLKRDNAFIERNFTNSTAVL